MKLVYIAGPYRDDRGEWFVRQNIRAAEAAAVAIWAMGAVAVCPHKNTAGLGGACPDHVWLVGDIEMLRRCDAIYMLDGWGGSRGASAEWGFAKENGIPVFETLDTLKDWLG